MQRKNNEGWLNPVKNKIKVKQGYGLTETSHFIRGITSNIVPGSCGILFPNIECKLISEDGQGISLCF